MSKFLPNQAMTALKYTKGTRESNTITLPAVGDATQGDYVMLYNAAGVSKAIYIDIDSDGTAPTGALYVASGSQGSLAYKNAVNETYVVTIPATASATQADYFMIYDEAGNSTAVWLDIDAAGTVPTGALYVASDSQITGGIATGDTSAQAATKVYTALNGNVTNVSFTDNLDGTITVALDNTGAATADALPKDADDSGAGSITIGTITKGVLATTAIAAGALLASAGSLTDTTFTDVGDGTVTFAASDIGNATNCVPKLADDSTAGSITVDATDGAVASFPYENPSESPTSRKVNPDTVS
jgi:hypothetical protein